MTSGVDGVEHKSDAEIDQRPCTKATATSTLEMFARGRYPTTLQYSLVPRYQRSVTQTSNDASLRKFWN